MKNIVRRTFREKIAALTVIFLIATLLAACASPVSESGVNSNQKETGGQPQAGNATGEASGVQLLNGGGPEPGGPNMEITRSVGTPNPSEGGQDSLTDSNGNVIPIQTPGSNEPGLAGGYAGGDSGGITNWPGVKFLTYTDEKYGFSVMYPDSYVIQYGPMEGQSLPLKAIYTVRFQDKVIAESDLADREPPQFMIEIYEGPGGKSLETWIKDNQFAPANSKFDAITKSGVKEGLHVTLPTLMAPNEAYFFVSGKYVYRIVPLAQYSQDMLASLRLPSE